MFPPPGQRNFEEKRIDMENRILGLHHITAIADNAKRNHSFYTRVLGLRLVKKTVNFDDPGTYHFYYGDETGSPGTILTFFPWEGIGKGTNGTGMATDIGYAVAKGSLDFWKARLAEEGLSIKEEEIVGQSALSFHDPDGLRLQLIETPDARKGWPTPEVSADYALKGFHYVGLTLRKSEPTARILTDVLGYELVKQDGNRARFATSSVENANLIDIIETPEGRPGRGAGGTNHHIAFRVKNDAVLMEYREKVLSAGLDITPKIDRDYFFSLYFREPGGVLFEIATDNPGFTRDEPLEDLGTGLKLPARYESSRRQIEELLPQL